MPGPTVAIVQARMGSTRLPGKALAELAGRPVLGFLLDRLAAAASLDAVTVATTTLDRDDPIAEAARAAGAEVFRGSEADVLGRYAGAAEQAGADVIVRLTSDCPLLDPAIVDLAVADFARGGADLVTNAPPVGRTYPDGMDVAVLSRETLERLDREVADPALREHVTAGLHRGPGVVRELHLPADHGEVRITIDTPEDLETVRALVARLPDGFSLDDVLGAL